MFYNPMQLVLQESKKIQDEIPIYCIIINENNKIIARAKNKVQKFNNPCLHAEIIAIQKALKKKNINDKFLENCSLYVNLEPCIMCGYAISLARIKNVFFGAKDDKFGFFSQKIPSNHIINNFQIMTNECQEVIDNFFIKKRQSNIIKSHLKNI